MKAYLAYLKSNLLLTMRDRIVLFFNFLFPLIFFMAFAEGFGAATSSGALSQVLAMVLMIGVLGSGFFGAGMRAVMDRESGILRRFKVAPIGPGPILAAGVITGWLMFIPTVFLFLAIGYFRYGAPIPPNLISLLVIVSVGSVAFRSVGLILASVVNSMAESQIIIQLMYLPMLMLSGATVPLNIMPEWLQSVAQFLPSTHMYLGMQGVLVRGESLTQNAQSLGALTLTAVLGLFISMKLFRWEKEEKLKGSAKLWVVAVLAPFLLIGAWQAHSKGNLKKTEMLAREMRRSQSWLIRDARIFVGDGRVIESGAILIRDGKIAKIYEGTSPEAKPLKAEAIEASGKTVLPGLIDSGVNMFLPGTGAPEMDPGRLTKNLEREAAAYLYSGVTAVRTVPDPMKVLPELKRRLDTAEIQGSEIFLAGGGASPASLSAAELQAGRTDILKDTLVPQVITPAQLEALRKMAKGKTADGEATLPAPPVDLAPASGSGAMMLPHGPVLHHEMKLWVAAGQTPAKVLQAATSGAAKLLGAGNRIGLVQPGYEATLLIVEGNPVEDITNTQRVWSVLFKGERVRRESLLNKDKDE